MAKFPFGWLREIEDDNWQILWDSETKIVYIKGALSRKAIDIGRSSTWQEAKSLAEKVMNEPRAYLSFPA